MSLSQDMAAGTDGVNAYVLGAERVGRASLGVEQLNLLQLDGIRAAEAGITSVGFDYHTHDADVEAIEASLPSLNLLAARVPDHHLSHLEVLGELVDVVVKSPRVPEDESGRRWPSQRPPAGRGSPAR
jgi:hypothetical protein